MSTALRPSDTVSWSYFIMLPVMATLLFPRKEKRKKKSNDYWKDSMLIRPLPDKKENINKPVPLWLDYTLEMDLNVFHEKIWKLILYYL